MSVMEGTPWKFIFRVTPDNPVIGKSCRPVPSGFGYFKLLVMLIIAVGWRSFLVVIRISGKSDFVSANFQFLSGGWILFGV